MAFFGAAQGAFTGDTERARQAADRARLALQAQAEQNRAAERRQDRADALNMRKEQLAREDQRLGVEERRYQDALGRQDEQTRYAHGMAERDWQNKMAGQDEEQRRYDRSSAWDEAARAQQQQAADLELEQKRLFLDRYKTAAQEETDIREKRRAMGLDSLVGLVEAARLNLWGDDQTPVVPMSALQLFKGDTGFPLKGGFIHGDVFYADTGAVDEQGNPVHEQYSLPALQQMYNRMNPRNPLDWYPTGGKMQQGKVAGDVEPDEKRDAFDVLEEEADALIKKIKAIPDNVDVLGKRRLTNQLQEVRENQERLLNERKTPKEPTASVAALNERQDAVLSKNDRRRMLGDGPHVEVLPPEQRDAAIGRLSEIHPYLFRRYLDEIVNDKSSSYENDRMGFMLLLKTVPFIRESDLPDKTETARSRSFQLWSAEKKMRKKWPQWENLFEKWDHKLGGKMREFEA